MFLWLTQNVDGQPRFLGFESPYALLGINNREVLVPRKGKSHQPESFDEFIQAGTDGVLVDKKGNAVYYSQYLNDVFVDFIKDKELTNPEKVRILNPNTSFPIGTLELKASWKIVENGEDTSNFFTMDSSVYGLANKGGKIVVDTSNILKVKLALVGFHIGGIVKGHPEMIWATFEHRKNAPNVSAKFTPSTVISGQDFTFYRAGTKYSGCNKNYASSPYLKLDEDQQKLSPVIQVCRQYPYGNSATFEGNVPALAKQMNVSLSMMQKNVDNMQLAVEKNDSDIEKLNDLVEQQLTKEKDVWANYYEVGAIWFKPTDALKPGMTLKGDFATNDSFPKTDKGEQFLIGSLKLSNSTIETFTQYQSTMNNCFRCHNTEERFMESTSGVAYKPLPAMNLNISHAFMNIYFWSQQQARGDMLLPEVE
ncbi:hypothetical protein ACH42_05550 [Endozoicomonas sp. (ex Bugula neritina AB1)]|nr:hypothetical protein ACH42_05550 [Endozoicomonas sp. (ex Bugula neritina AB1)]